MSSRMDRMDLSDNAQRARKSKESGLERIYVMSFPKS